MTALTIDAANLVLLVGELSGPPRHRQLPSGDELVEFDVITRGHSGTASVPVAWFGPDGADAPLAAGQPVVVAGHVRRRFFRAGGATQSRTEVVAERVLVAARPASVTRLRQQLVNALAAGSSS